MARSTELWFTTSTTSSNSVTGIVIPGILAAGVLGTVHPPQPAYAGRPSEKPFSAQATSNTGGVQTWELSNERAPVSDEAFVDLALGLASRQTDLGPEISRVLARRMSDLYE